MPQSFFRNRTALVLGADTPAGRAIALKFSRIGARAVLGGFALDRLELLEKLIRDKGGDPIVLILPREADDACARLRSTRGAFGHVHAAVNAVAASSYHGDERDYLIDVARRLGTELFSYVEGKGTVRLATLWPDDAGDSPEIPKSFWHSLVRVHRIASDSSGFDDVTVEEGVRPAAVADALLHLLACEGGACPIEVRLEERKSKV